MAELIDNSLRATKGLPADSPRSITVSLVLPERDRSSAGLICVRDNGKGSAPASSGLVCTDM